MPDEDCTSSVPFHCKIYCAEVWLLGPINKSLTANKDRPSLVVACAKVTVLNGIFLLMVLITVSFNCPISKGNNLPSHLDGSGFMAMIGCPLRYFSVLATSPS